jgi:hypothetical protein
LFSSVHVSELETSELVGVLGGGGLNCLANDGWVELLEKGWIIL